MKRFTKLLTLILIMALVLTLCPITTITAEDSSALPVTTNAAPPERDGGLGHADKNGAVADAPSTGGGDVVDFSENNLLMSSFYSGAPYGYYGGVNNGGTANMAAAYFARWGGPINEGDDPYYNYKLVTNYSPVTRISDVLMIPHTDSNNLDDIAAIKQAVYDNGAAYISMQYLSEYMTDPTSTTAAYYLPPSVTLYSNYGHAVTVVGWDDNYAVTNFSASSRPSAPGAFLIKNSYGTGGALGGYFYLSYYDQCVGKPIEIDGQQYSNTTAVFVTGNAAAESYDHNYQHDPYGYTSAFSLSASGNTLTSYTLANKFTAGGNETVKAVSFYTTSPNVSYSAYVVTGDTLPSAIALSETTPNVSGTQPYAGYHTVSLNTPVAVAAGQRFSVILKISNTIGYAVCIEQQQYYAGTQQKVQLNLDMAPQQSYIYNGGWDDLTDSYYINIKGNLCIKAFTVDGTTGGASEPVLGGSETASPPAPGESTATPLPGESAPVPGVSEPVPGTSEPVTGAAEALTESNPAPASRLAVEVAEQKPIPLPEGPLVGGSDSDGFTPGVLLDPNNLYFSDGGEPATGGTPPLTYDLRKSGEVTSVKNQGAVGACWTFAAIASAESTYMRSKKSFVGNVTLSKNATYLKNTNTTGITITASAIKPAEVLTYEWDIPQGSAFATIVPGSSACTIKPIAGAQGIAQVRCIVTYKSSAVPIAAADINIVVGDYGAGDGSLASPYIVDSPADLQLLGGFTGSAYRGKYFQQKADIDLSSIPNWTPIGTYYMGYAFEGNYNGNSYTINNLTINATQPVSENTGFGLFNCIENGTVKDVTLNNCNITISAPQNDGNYIIGGLAARADNATVQDCFVNGSIKVTLTGAMKAFTYSGGLIGYALNLNLSRCGFMGGITQTGGLWSSGSGLLSYLSGGTIDQSFATSTLSSKGQTGGRLTSQSGLVDELQLTTVTNSYAVSTITAANLPAISCGAGMTSVPGDCHFINCYTSTKISGPATTRGAFFGYYGYDTVLTNCYYNLTTKNSMYLNGLGTWAGSLTGLYAQDMQNAAKYTGWDFTTTWATSVLQNGGFPFHKTPIVGLDFLMLGSDMPGKIYRGTKAPLSFELFPAIVPPQVISVSFDPPDAFTVDGSGNLVAATGTGYRGMVNLVLNHPAGATGTSLILDDKKADIDKNGTVDAATAVTRLLNYLTGKSPLDDYYLYDINRSSASAYSALDTDVTLSDLLALRQYQAGLREINP